MYVANVDNSHNSARDNRVDVFHIHLLDILHNNIYYLIFCLAVGSNHQVVVSGVIA